MLSAVRAFTLDGIAARPVRVEVDVHRGLPGFSLVGLPDPAVRETRERVRAALANCGFEFPMQRIVANLAPASLRKAGPGLDLPIAAGLLAASGQLEWEALPRLAMVGELALDGTLRAVPGALAFAEAARDLGAEAIVVPAANGREAALAGEIEVLALDSLSQVTALAAGEWRPLRPEPLPLRPAPAPGGPDFAELRGQPHLRYALEVAAAGGHGLLMVGPPGAGKSLAATRLPSILPPLAPEGALEVARIASACGRLAAWSGGRPFRAPHHTISPAGLAGAGNPPLPGEATLAHRGVLFLDELCEFHRDSLEALREPLESGWVSIARAGSVRRLPCRFMLLAAANPCPCGYGEEEAPECNCAPAAVRRYRERLGGALAERLDILVAVRAPSAAQIGGPPGEPSTAVRERVCAARERQERRLGPGRCNAEMTPGEARECVLTDSAAALLAEAHSRRRLGGRAHERVLRLARTVADLAGAEAIEREQIAQAMQLRRRDRD
jgi:magnesium chelatase family protein